MADTNGNGRKPRPVNPNIQRISLSMDATTRRNIRIASALENLSDGDWCTNVLNRAADIAIPDELKAQMKLRDRKARAKK